LSVDTSTTTMTSGYFHFIISKLQLWWYRFVTAIRAFWALYHMPEEKVTAFLQSYELFEKDKMNGDHTDQNLIQDYYAVLNYLCAIGEVEKMYIPPKMDNTLGIYDNQLLFEKSMVKQLGITNNHRVLDLGCGRGRVAAHMCQASGGATIYGINIDQEQLDRAVEHASSNPFLSKRLNFRQGNFNHPLPYADNFFDSLYQIQVLTYATDMDALAREMYRVLKPGTKLSFLDWVQLENYNPSNSHHVSLIRRIKPLIGAVTTPSPKDFERSLEKAGFKIVISRDASVDGHQAELIEKACFFYESFNFLINFFVAIRVLPRHLKLLFDRLTKDGDAFIEADRLAIFTTSYQIVAEKPRL